MSTVNHPPSKYSILVLKLGPLMEDDERNSILVHKLGTLKEDDEHSSSSSFKVLHINQ